MMLDPATVLTALFITGLVVEAMTGAIAAGKLRMDLFGVLVVANVTAFGGGVIRDLLIDRSPIMFIDKPALLLLTSVAALVMVVTARFFHRLKWLFLALDALGMITFTMVGAMRAADMGYGAGVASLAGLTTGVFGGILRDILCNRIPLAFQKELYASISIGAVWLYLVLVHFELPKTIATLLPLVIGFCCRMLAVKYDWRIPRFVYE